MKTKLLYILIFIFIILLFINYDIVLTSSIDAVDIWLKRVFPLLFIMFIINDILINLNFESVFKSSTFFVFIMSLLSGAPSSAFIINNLYLQNKIDKNNANNYLLFTYFSNPLFLYSMLNLLFPLIITIKLMIIHYISNLILYLINKNKITKFNTISYNVPKINISNSIKKSITTLTMILGTIVFYMVFTNILSKTLNFNPISTTFLKGFLELTQGLNILTSLTINLKLKEIIAIAFISFGGLSIHTQIKCILDESKLDYKYFLKGRILQTIIAILLTLITNTF